MLPLSFNGSVSTRLAFNALLRWLNVARHGAHCCGEPRYWSKSLQHNTCCNISILNHFNKVAVTSQSSIFGCDTISKSSDSVTNLVTKTSELS